MTKIIIEKDDQFIHSLQEKINKEKFLASWQQFKLYYEARKQLSIKQDSLTCLRYLPNITLLPHQIKTCKKVLDEMNGRAILADEVGLGKTIEAACILKELLIRRMVRRVLILVPATLVDQWVHELSEKFLIPVTLYHKNMDWQAASIVVTSLDLAKGAKHREIITKISYDLLIVDEAHKLRNPNTINYQFVQAIQKKYCLLLTATPIQNKLADIFHLITILKPGYLGNLTSFLKQGKMLEKNNTHMKTLLQAVMIRHRREDIDLAASKRSIQTSYLQFDPATEAAYQMLDEALEKLPAMTKWTFLKQLCSSREAAYLSLERTMTEKNKKQIEPVLEEIASLPHHVKAENAVAYINQFPNDKIIIFTQYKPSQFYLQWYLTEHNISAVSYTGDMSQSKKSWMLAEFKRNKQVLIATEAGSEGINLQFASHIINYDLPWNPMRIEQRIGRIHRLGQKNDVHIIHFAIKNTLEEHVLKTLHEKVDLVEQTVGDIDEILTAES